MRSEPIEWLRHVIDRHAPALELYARQWVRNPEDIVQEAMIQLVQQKSRPDNPAAWLFRVVRNRAISAARSAARRQRHESTAAGQHRAWFVSNNGQSLDAGHAANALSQLPEIEREIVVAHLWGGLTFEQVGQLVGNSSSAVHRRYVRALQSLRERMRSE